MDKLFIMQCDKEMPSIYIVADDVKEAREIFFTGGIIEGKLKRRLKRKIIVTEIESIEQLTHHVPCAFQVVEDTSFKCC